MPSSTSSSEGRRRWAAAAAIALAIALCASAAIERYWRARGYVPAAIDSMSLWSQQRDRVYSREHTPLVLLGASRIQLGIDMSLLRELLPAYRPVMLAINGRYPLASLRDLADDEAFRGIVLCDIESRGFELVHRQMQQPYVDYYRTRWTPSGRLHRIALTFWQRHALIANPDFGALASLRRWLASGGAPWKSYVRYRRDRSGDADYIGFDAAPYAKAFADGYRHLLAEDPPQPPERWLAGLAPVRAWVQRIRARGGEVIFYNTPSSGALQALADAAYPSAPYWNRLGEALDAPTLDYREVPALTALSLPDGSHLDYRDKAAYTRALAQTLIEHGWLRGSDQPRARTH